MAKGDYYQRRALALTKIRERIHFVATGKVDEFEMANYIDDLMLQSQTACSEKYLLEKSILYIENIESLSYIDGAVVRK